MSLGQILYWTTQILQFHDLNSPSTSILLNFAVDKQAFGKPSHLPSHQVTVPHREASTYPSCANFWRYSTQLHAFYRTYYSDYVFSEETEKLCDRQDHGFLCVPWLLQPTPTLSAVIYRPKYDTFTGHAKNINRKIYDIQAYWNNIIWTWSRQFKV